MAARSDHNQPTISHSEASRVFVPMLVWYRLSGEFFGREMVVHIGRGIAADPVVNAWSSTTIGASDNTGCTSSAFSLRRSKGVPKLVKLPSGLRRNRLQKLSSPPV